MNNCDDSQEDVDHGETRQPTDRRLTDRESTSQLQQMNKGMTGGKIMRKITLSP